MASRSPTPSPQRRGTDQSLHSERQKTDDEFGRRVRSIEARADDTVERARAHTDREIDRAREETAAEPSVEPPKERVATAGTIERERQTADDERAVERDARKRVLRTLLQAERELTDERLLAERVDADEVLAAISGDNARLQTEAERALHLRDAFLAIAGHELKTPLTPIRLRVQSLSREVRASADHALVPAELGRKIDAIDRQLRRLESLIHDLLDVSRLSGQHLRLEVEEVNLSDFVAELATRLEPDAERARAALSVEVPAGIVGQWDRLRLEQILTSLLSNALKFGAGKPVRLSAVQRGEEVEISVADEGPGITPEDQARIFGRFERAVSPRNFGGFGLGLWVVRQAAEAMGGEISVRSELGAGATFTLRLPIVARETATEAPPPRQG